MPSNVLVAFAFALALLGADVRAAPAAAEDVRAELLAIRKLSETSVPAALRRLEALQAVAVRDLPYALRYELLRTEFRLRQDAGQMEAAHVAEQAALQLALANKDAAGAALARLGTIRRLVDGGRAGDAQQALDRIVREAPHAPSTELRVALSIAQGDIHDARAQFDRALASYLNGMKLLEGDPARGQLRGHLYSRIAQLYTSSDNPDKALDTIARGLAEPGLPVRVTGTLQYMQGTALLDLDRPDAGIAAFRRALDTAVGGGLGALEASVRGNIADYYLRQRDWGAAEREARLALEASTRTNYQQLIIMARVNLGFALMGLGRVAEGLVHVDGVIAELERAKSWNNLEAVLDEKSRMLEGARLYKDALATVRGQQKLQEDSARIARDRAIAALQEEYDAAQRTRQISLLNRENLAKEAELQSRRIVQLVSTFAAGITVLASAVVFVLYRRARRSALRLEQLNKQLEFHSMRDALTGLYNRRSFLEKMDARAALAEGDRRKGSPQDVDCFVLMDIDHFKHINDRWGHGVGDAVLVEVARRLTMAVRDTDMVLRWGGEEFLVYAPATAPACIAELADRILQAVGAAPVDAGTCSVPVTVSAGVAILPAGARQDGAEWQRAIRLADWALYHGKQNGRNQARIVSRMGAPIDTVLVALESAGHGAIPAGLVELSVVPGPVRQPA